MVTLLCSYHTTKPQPKQTLRNANEKKEVYSVSSIVEDHSKLNKSSSHSLPSNWNS